MTYFARSNRWPRSSIDETRFSYGPPLLGTRFGPYLYGPLRSLAYLSHSQILPARKTFLDLYEPHFRSRSFREPQKCAWTCPAFTAHLAFPHPARKMLVDLSCRHVPLRRNLSTGNIRGPISPLPSTLTDLYQI